MRKSNNLLDEIDRKILALLTQNARIAINDLARQVSRSRAVIYDRIAKLERGGHIGKYTILPNKDIAASKSAICAYFLLNLDGPICKTIAPKIILIPEVKISQSISGMIDMILYAETDSLEQLAIVRQEIEAIKGVNMVKTLPILMHHFDRS